MELDLMVLVSNLDFPDIIITMYLARELNMQNIEIFIILLFERNRGQIQDVIIQKQITLKHIS